MTTLYTHSLFILVAILSASFPLLAVENMESEIPNCHQLFNEVCNIKPTLFYANNKSCIADEIKFSVHEHSYQAQTVSNSFTGVGASSSLKVFCTNGLVGVFTNVFQNEMFFKVKKIYDIRSSITDKRYQGWDEKKYKLIIHNQGQNRNEAYSYNLMTSGNNTPLLIVKKTSQAYGANTKGIQEIRISQEGKYPHEVITTHLISLVKSQNASAELIFISPNSIGPETIYSNSLFDIEKFL